MNSRVQRPPAFVELEELLGHLHRARLWVDEEIARTRYIGAISKVLLAVDFDIIYDFIYLGQTARYSLTERAGFSVIQALKGLSDLQFTLLPGTVHELLVFCSRLAGRLPVVRHADDLLSLVAREISAADLSKLDFDQALRRKLFLLIHSLNEETLVMAQLSSLVSAPNLTGVLESGIPQQKVFPDPALGKLVFQTLSRHRPTRPAPNVVDSLNVSIVLTAAGRDVILPLITKSPVVRRAYLSVEGAIGKTWGPYDLVVSPERALFTIGLHNARQVDLESLLSDLWMVESTVQEFLITADSSTSLEQARENLLLARKMVGALSDLAEIAPKAWSMPEIELPAEIDLPGLAAATLGVAEQAKREIQKAISRIASLFSRWGAVIERVGKRFDSWQALLPVLELLEEADFGSRVFIDKLIVIGRLEGPMDLTTLNISGGIVGLLSTGDLHRVKNIDTQITTLTDTGHTEVAKAFKALTEAVAASEETGESQRNEILDQLDELSRQAGAIEAGEARPGVIRALLAGLGGTLSAAGGLAEVWSTWGPAIQGFFARALGGG